MRLELDGQEAALLRGGEVVDLDVDPGEHVLVLRAGASRSHRHRVDVLAGAAVELEIDLAWSSGGAATGTYLALVPLAPWAPPAADGSGVPLDDSHLPAAALGAAWFIPLIGIPLSIAALRRPGLTTLARSAAAAGLAVGVAQVALVAALVADARGG